MPPVVRELPETHFRVMRLIERNPRLTQRELARELGVSLGKVNYCVQALLEKGLVKGANFQANPNKLGYTYLLTPTGMRAKARLTKKFLERKVAEYEALSAEIASLEQELVKERGKE